MSKTIISTISKNYAKALLDSVDNPVEILKQLDSIEQIINSSEDLQIVISNSSISLTKKIEIINTIFENKIDSKLLNFLKILIEKNRFSEFENIKEAFQQLVNNITKKKTVTVISPIALNFENRTNILFKLEHKLNCEINPIWEVDSSLIAGLIFKFDDYIIDTSVRNKLENLGKI